MRYVTSQEIRKLDKEATEGKALGSCIKAARTVTFAFPKTGFIKNDGPDKVGALVVADISLPA